MPHNSRRSPRKAPTPRAVRIKSNKRGVKKITRPNYDSITDIDIGDQKAHDQSPTSKKTNRLPEISTKVKFKYIDMNDFAKTT